MFGSKLSARVTGIFLDLGTEPAEITIPGKKNPQPSSRKILRGAKPKMQIVSGNFVTHFTIQKACARCFSGFPDCFAPKRLALS